MIAQVLSVEPNKTFQKRNGGTYTALSVITQGKPYKGQVKDPREHKFFSNHPLHDKLAALKPGTWIEYKCDNSRYKVMESFTVLDEQEATNDSPTTAQDAFKADDSNNKDAQIARAVAIKAATDTIVAMYNKDAFKKSAKPDFVANEILQMSRFFENYLTFKDDEPKEVATSSTSELNSNDDLD